MAMIVPEIKEQFRYQSPQVPAARLQGMQVQTNAALFGAESGRQMEKAGYLVQRGADQLGRLYVDYQHTKATEAYNKFQESLTEDLYGEKGLFNLKGEAAMNAPAQAQALLEAKSKEFAQGNGLAQGFFEDYVGRFRRQLMPQVGRFATEKRNDWMMQTQEARATTSLDMALKNYTDPNAYKSFMVEGLDALSKAGELAGLPPEMVKAKRDAFLSKGYSGIATAHIATGNYAAAEGILKNGVLSGADSIRLQEHIVSRRKADAAEARANEDRAKEAQANSRYTEFYANLKELPLDERTAAGMEMLEGIEDPKIKTRMLARFRQDIGMETVRQNAQASVQVRQFKEAANKQGWLPSQALTALEQVDGLLPQAREHLRKELVGEERKPTKENIAKSNELLRLIDKREVVDDRGIDAFAWEHGLTDTQTERARKYYNDGGNKSQVSMSRVEQLYKKMNKGKKAPEWLFDAVRENLEPGKSVTEEHLRKTIANLYMDGETDGSGWLSDKETYASSLREGRGDKWLPAVSDAERKEISAILRGQGVRVTDERVRQYKKEHIMGIGKEDAE